MIKDGDIANLLLALYSYPNSQVSWDHLDDGTQDDEICWAVKQVGETDVVCLRGSTTFKDWTRDFNAWANPFKPTNIGHVHPGFWLGMEQMWGELRLKRTVSARPMILAGHSLGAARASILTGLMVRDNLAPALRVVCGEPKPGFADFANLIAKVPARSYCVGDDLGHDLITEVPFSFPPENYIHPVSLISVKASPQRHDEWGPFKYHHMELYQEALKGI
jgi:hypothetical protein